MGSVTLVETKDQRGKGGRMKVFGAEKSFQKQKKQSFLGGENGRNQCKIGETIGSHTEVRGRGKGLKKKNGKGGRGKEENRGGAIKRKCKNEKFRREP